MRARSSSPRRITMADVAAHARVSTATVSRVLNGSGIVAPDTADRVYEAIAELKYIPHVGARDLASGLKNTLGLIFFQLSGTFFSAMLKGIEDCVHRHGYALLIYSTQGHTGDERRLVLPLGEHNTDGLIIFTNSLEDSHLARLHARRFPLVLLHQSPANGFDIPCVLFENEKGARQAVEHLILVHGHRRIAFLAGPSDNYDALRRKAGYEKALREHGIPFDPALVAQGDFDDKVSEAAVADWLANGRAFDAIFAADDESATGALTALRTAGVRVPDDVALVGFDDSLLSRHLTPPLTTVRAPIEQAGYEAADKLIQLIKTGNSEMVTELPTQLVARSSCGCGDTPSHSSARRKEVSTES